MSKDSSNEQVQLVFNALGSKSKLKSKLRMMSDAQFNRFQDLIFSSIDDVLKEKEQETLIKKAIVEKTNEIASELSEQYGRPLHEVKDIISSNLRIMTNTKRS